MYKNKEENIEIYFICYKKEEMDLIESYYDEILNVHYWYFNAYLAYQLWLKKFKGIQGKELLKKLLVVAASRYLIYLIENEKYKNESEHRQILKDLEKIQKELKKVISEEDILKNL